MPEKTSRVHGTIQRTTRMLVFAPQPDVLPFRTPHPAGTGISERSFARPQRRFRRHCEVNAPDLRLRFHPENLHGTVRSAIPPLRSVSRPITGRDLHREPVFPRISPALRDFPGIHSPSGLLKPSGSKRSTGSIGGSSPGGTPVNLLTRRYTTLRLRRGAVPQNPFRPARLIVP